MDKKTEKRAPEFLLRLREQDTPTGVSEATVDKLMAATGLNKTELTHLALRQMADRYLPFYEQDGGPLSAKQIAAVRRASTATATPESIFTERLF